MNQVAHLYHAEACVVMGEEGCVQVEYVCHVRCCLDTLLSALGCFLVVQFEDSNELGIGLSDPPVFEPKPVLDDAYKFLQSFLEAPNSSSFDSIVEAASHHLRPFLKRYAVTLDQYSRICAAVQ